MIYKYIVAFILLIVLIFTFDKVGKKILYHPERDIPGKVFPFQDIYIPNGKNKINAWYLPAADKNKPTILFVHGNAGNVGYFQYPGALAEEKGWGLLIFDYPSFGNSNGKITETNMYDSAQKTLDYMQTQLGIDKSNIVIWGYSLGGAIGAKTAAANKVKGVILHSTFTNVPEIGYMMITGSYKPGSVLQKVLMPFFYLITANKIYNNKKYVKQIENPLLVVYSSEDEIVPAQITRELVISSAPKGTEVFVSPKGSHVDLLWAFPPVSKFIENLK